MFIYGFTISKQKDDFTADVEAFLSKKGLKPEVQKFDGNKMYSVIFATEQEKRNFEKEFENYFEFLFK